MTKITYDELLDLVIVAANKENKPIIHYGSKENPYITLVTKIIYKEIKKYLDKEDMFDGPDGWVKIVVCD